MNWYKQFRFAQSSQPTASLLEQEKTDVGGIDFPPIDHNDASDSHDFDPDDKIIDGIAKWVSEGKSRKMEQQILYMVMENIEPEVDVSVNIFESIDIPLQVSGSAKLNLKLHLPHQCPMMEIIVQHLKPQIFKSDLWKYIGVPYESAYQYIENGIFIDVVVATIANNAFQNASNECAFWMYENASKYTNSVKQSIINEISRRFKGQADLSQLQISGNKKPTCRGLAFMGDFGCILLPEKDFDFTVPTWTFKQNNNSAFERLAASTQKSLVYFLQDILSNQYDIISENNTVDAYAIIRGFQNIDDLIIDPDEITIKEPINNETLSGLDENAESIISGLLSIPGSLLQRISYIGSYEAQAKDSNYKDARYEPEEIDIKLILSIQKITIKENMLILKINIEGLLK
jgi:hypothetical protein